MERVFAEVIKDLEMRSCWITQMGPKFNGERPSKRQERKRQRREKPGEDRGGDWSSHEAY